MKLTEFRDKLPSPSYIPQKYRAYIREKAIDRAKTRIAIAGGNAYDMCPKELEILVREEEDKIKQSAREKGILAILAVLGINLFG